MIASCAGGLYYFIEAVDNIPVAFADCLGGLQSVVAQNIKLAISAEAGVTISRVHNGKYRLVGTVPSTGTVTVEVARPARDRAGAGA